MPNVVLRDKSLQEEFDKKGYVQVPFLDASEVEYLKQMFFETLPESGGSKTSNDTDFKTESEITYDFTFIDRNPEYKKKVFNIITTAFQKRVDEYLNDYTPIIANYIRKKEGGGEVPLHQNWAFVEEDKFTSVSIWVPLVDSNEENGTLQMVDGSHKKFGRLRGPLIPWELEGIKQEIINKHLTPMNVKAGTGVILDDSIVHYSNINQTSGLRLTIQLILIPKCTHPVHYHLDRTVDKNKVHVFETDQSFYMEFHPWLQPHGKRELKVLKFKDHPFTYEEFLKGLKGKRFDQTPGLLNKAMGLLKGL
jgi:hypothetical protein